MMAAAIPDDPCMMAYYHSHNPWSFAGEGNGNWGTNSQRESLYTDFRAINTWADDKGLEIFLGEFGAVQECDYNSRMDQWSGGLGCPGY